MPVWKSQGQSRNPHRLSCNCNCGGRKSLQLQENQSSCSRFEQGKYAAMYPGSPKTCSSTRALGNTLGKSGRGTGRRHHVQNFWKFPRIQNALATRRRAFGLVGLQSGDHMHEGQHRERFFTMLSLVHEAHDEPAQVDSVEPPVR